MNEPRSRAPDGVVARRPPAFIETARSTREALAAGASPNQRPLSTESAVTNARTPPSIATCEKPLASAGSTTFRPRTASCASATPSRPPMSASATLSVSSCRRMRLRLAPSAARSPISLRRDAARESSRLATFAHAISSTIPTAAWSTSSGRRTSCTRFVWSGSASASAFHIGAGHGKSAAIRPIIGRSSWLACASVAPGFSRATTGIQPKPQ
jgi:hypothetical protein